MRRVVQCLNWRAVVKKKGWIIALAPLVFCQTLPVCAQIAVLQQDDPSTPSFSRQLMELQLDPLRLRKLEKAINARDYSFAIIRLQKVIELDPKMMRAYDTLGLCFDYLGKFDEAVKNYNRAVELNRLQSKPSPWPHVDLAISFIALNRLPEAEKNLREAVGYDPRLPQAHYQLGRVLEMQGDYQAAVESLKQAVALDTAYPEPHYLLGKIYHRLGSEPLSKAEIDRFLELRKASEAQLALESPLSPM